MTENINPKPEEVKEEKIEEKAEDVEDETEEDSTKYSAKYVRISKLKPLFVEERNGSVQKIHISKDAKEVVAKYLDDAVAKAITEIIAKLPRKEKGDNKGELKRITIQADDFKV